MARDVAPAFRPPGSPAPPIPSVAASFRLPSPLPLFLEPREPSPPPVQDRGLGWFSNHLAATWELLATGCYIRLLNRHWPPTEVGWLSLARPSGVPDDRIVPVSVGQFQVGLRSITAIARLPGECWRISYGRCGIGKNGSSRWPAGQVVAHFRHARPAEYAAVDLPVRIRKPHGKGPYQIVLPETGGDE